jgi:hypothetical protein
MSGSLLLDEKEDGFRSQLVGFIVAPAAVNLRQGCAQANDRRDCQGRQ